MPVLARVVAEPNFSYVISNDRHFSVVIIFGLNTFRLRYFLRVNRFRLKLRRMKYFRFFLRAPFYILRLHNGTSPVGFVVNFFSRPHSHKTAVCNTFTNLDRAIALELFLCARIYSLHNDNAISDVESEIR